MPGAFMCSVFNPCGGIDFLQYWTIRCRIQVSYMYQMYRESLGAGISAVSQLALMSARCAVSRPVGHRDLPTLLAYYPYYCILPLPPTPTSYYPYYPYLLPTSPTTPTTLTYYPYLLPPTTNPSNTPCTGYCLLSLPPHLLPPTTLMPLLPPTYSTPTTPATSCYSFATPTF